MKAKVRKKPKRISKLKVALAAAAELTPKDKKRLLVALEDELDGPIQLQPWQIEELEKSMAEYEADPRTAKPWEEVRAKLREKYDF
jgi:putative addiction module component (TIGR02574 family)